jgi:hypothetical protein
MGHGLSTQQHQNQLKHRIAHLRDKVRLDMRFIEAVPRLPVTSRKLPEGGMTCTKESTRGTPDRQLKQGPTLPDTGWGRFTATLLISQEW